MQIVSVAHPAQRGEVIGVDEGGHPDERPVLVWTGPDTLQAGLPNYSFLGLYVRQFDTVRIDLQFEHNDPDSRAAALKRLGFPLDS